jgi:23S rRNA (adenine2030-N6)-methyltransferase
LRRTIWAAARFREARLNYRHHFHAGNFADLLKHGLLLHLIDRLTAGPEPLSVLDTHAGAGA